MLGNPGLIDYYIPFLQTVHDKCDGKIDIFGGMLQNTITQSRSRSRQYRLESDIAHLAYFPVSFSLFNGSLLKTRNSFNTIFLTVK